MDELKKAVTVEAKRIIALCEERSSTYGELKKHLKREKTKRLWADDAPESPMTILVFDIAEELIDKEIDTIPMGTSAEEESKEK